MQKGLLKLMGCLLISLVRMDVSAQKQPSDISAGVSIGTFVYQGDLTPFVSGSLKTIKPGVSLSLTRVSEGKVAVKYALAGGTLTGDDVLYQKDQFYRGFRRFSFESRFAELSVAGNVFLQKRQYSHRRIQPYISIGLAGTYLFNRSMSTEKTDFGYFSTEDLLNRAKKDSVHGIPSVLFVVPAGLGVNIRLSDKIFFNLEGLYRLTSTDYLDGFSVAANNKKNDYYYGVTAGLHYQLGKKGKKESVYSGVADEVKRQAARDTVFIRFADMDKDGIADSIDACPSIRGPIQFHGCPSMPEKASENKLYGLQDSSKNGMYSELKPDSVQRRSDTSKFSEVNAVKEKFADNKEMEKSIRSDSTIYETPSFIVYFEFDKYNLNGYAFNVLNELVDILKRNPSYHVILRGHTDLSGSIESNFVLSWQRTKICADFLASYSIDHSRISQEAYSKLRPVTASADQRVQWKNRRVEILLVKK